MLKVKTTQLIRNPAQPKTDIDPTIAQQVKVERTGQIIGLAPLGVENYEMSGPRKTNGVIVLMDDNNKLEEFQLKEIEVIK